MCTPTPLPSSAARIPPRLVRVLQSLKRSSAPRRRKSPAERTKSAMEMESSPPGVLEIQKRDAYGFLVRPQHVQTYREYAKIYKEEEGERSARWQDFLERLSEWAQMEGPDASGEDVDRNGFRSCEDGLEKAGPALNAIEEVMSYRVKKRKTSSSVEKAGGEVARPTKGTSGEEYEEECLDSRRLESAQEDAEMVADHEPLFPWKEELESLVREGVPMALRGELWQAFVGVKTRRVEGYYNDLLEPENDRGVNTDADASVAKDTDNTLREHSEHVAPEKWKGQIEKDLPRTFPGHPALDEEGRNALRRLLTAYARHNPSVGYCQAMNFFAGLLLLLIPEENAFWTLTAIIDDYFDGYYSEEMVESQVDQLVFEDLVREKFPKLVNHLDHLGVQVAWVTGPWFLSIFMNVIPWESVLRVWDVLLFEGNRVMLFRTAFALMELYGPALVTTKDAGDAIMLFQSLAGSTFDSSQLVLTACMGFQLSNELELLELRQKHRPAVLAAIEERSKGLHASKGSQALASKLYSFKRDPGSLLTETKSTEELSSTQTNGRLHPLKSRSSLEKYFTNLTLDAEVDSVPCLEEQAMWLKVELSRLLEEKRSAVLRTEELEMAMMEMTNQDDRGLSNATVEQLEQQVSELRQALADKQEQEHAVLQFLMKVAQEQKDAEDARISAEQDAAAQRAAAIVLQEKYEEAMFALAQMEKRVVMAETMLEGTRQFQSGLVKAQQTPPRYLWTNQELSQDASTSKTSLLSRPFGLSWLDKSKKAGFP